MKHPRNHCRYREIASLVLPRKRAVPGQQVRPETLLLSQVTGVFGTKHGSRPQCPKALLGPERLFWQFLHGS